MKQNIIYELEEEYLARYYDEYKGKWVICKYSKATHELIVKGFEYTISAKKDRAELSLPRANTVLHRFPKNY